MSISRAQQDEAYYQEVRRRASYIRSEMARRGLSRGDMTRDVNMDLDQEERVNKMTGGGNGKGIYD